MTRMVCSLCLLGFVGLACLACEGQQETRDDGVEGELSFLVQDLTTALTGNPRRLHVRTCGPASDGESCLPCDDESKLGLELREVGGGNADVVRFRCRTPKAGDYCLDRETSLLWSFKKLVNSIEYRGHIEGEDKGDGGDTGVYTPDDVTEEGNFTMTSGFPLYPGTSAQWPYRIDLYQVEESGTETLVACADPLVIIDP
ncbi:MAG TPA: hypothetical protein VMT85_18745 [Thermoanaerobaculia bacterium]|nr:hypothetical protein [Thermoanaerobaculia bacterium]